MNDFSQFKVGVLALQGDFEAHLRQVALIGARGVAVRLPHQLTDVSALIIPGGESTTMNLLIDRFALRKPLTEFGRSRPVWGTCAGMIILSKTIDDNQSGITPLGLLDISVRRNGYGRQLFSFVEAVRIRINEVEMTTNASFIRAPLITRYGQGVQILASYQGNPILVRERNVLASSFHTELWDDTTLLRQFLSNFLLGSPVSR
jgi:pyridoxal 5'-phosphate synthase pdxT subunit